MIRNISFVVLLLFVNMFHGHSQPMSLNDATIKNIKGQLNDVSTNQQKIKLLLLLSQLLLAKESDTPSINDAILYTDTAIVLSTTLKDQAHLSDAYLIRSHLAQIQHDYKKGISFATNAIKLSEQLGDHTKTGEGYVLVWSNNSLNGMQLADRIPILKQALNAFHVSNSRIREADCLEELADLYQSTDQVGLSLNCLKRALELYQIANHPQVQAVYDLLGVTYLLLGDYKSAIHNGLMAVKTAEDYGDTSLSLCTYYNRLGLSYLRYNDLVQSRKYLEKSLAVAVKYKDNDGIFQLTHNIAFLFLREKRPNEALHFITNMLQRYPGIKKGHEAYIAFNMIAIYQQLKRYKDAMPYVLLVEKVIAEDSTNYTAIPHAYDNLIPFYIETGNIKKASLYTKRLRDLCQAKDIIGFKAEGYLFQYRIDSINGNYLSAIRNYRLYNELKDSLFDEDKSQQINQLNISFETEKKDHDIQGLKRESQLQQSHLKQATLMRNIYLVGSISLLIILLLLFYGFKIKQRTNRILRQQQGIINFKNDSLQHLLTEKEWLVKEIHHRIKNNLHMVAGLLSSQTEFLQGEEAITAIKDSQHRIQAMSLIHQRLYQSENLSYTEMPSYIFDLTEYIKDAYGRDVSIISDIAKVEFTLTYSVPIGLILNEAITNALKYAFPAGNKGIIKIDLKEVSTTNYVLQIQDNGIGLPPDFDPDKCLSLGLNLMKGLSADLNGSFVISSYQGTKIEIVFKAEDVKQII